MKTGFTNKSKYSLVATAARGGHHLISVVLGAENKDVRAAVSTNMLNRGFKMLGVTDVPPVVTTPVYSVPTAPVTTFGAAYNAATAQVAPTTVAKKPTQTSTGSAGVQFGAFGSEYTANTHVQTLKNKLGITAVVEPTGSGLYRVRAYGFSESTARDIKNRADTLKIDSYIFH